MTERTIIVDAVIKMAMLLITAVLVPAYSVFSEPLARSQKAIGARILEPRARNIRATPKGGPWDNC